MDRDQIRAQLNAVFRPQPELDTFDTGLGFTDILFGFVTYELFIRLQSWPELDTAVRLHLVVGTTLVLGSWIGFRRSLHRPRYQLKFFNLPFFRFLLDQLMLILYFRIAVLTPGPDIKDVPIKVDLISQTIELVVWVFALYLLWDILGIWMANARTKGKDGIAKPLYPEAQDHKMTERPMEANWVGFCITLGGLAFSLAALRLVGCVRSSHLFLAITAILVVYRWVKEMRTSWRLLRHQKHE